MILALLALAATYAGWRVARTALEWLRRLPRNKDDMVFF